jgi:hypothetical protein
MSKTAQCLGGVVLNPAARIPNAASYQFPDGKQQFHHYLYSAFGPAAFIYFGCRWRVNGFRKQISPASWPPVSPEDLSFKS